MNRCVWCGRWAFPVKGLYLEKLYPGRTTCTGCGRLQLHCSCVDFVDRFIAGRSYGLESVVENDHAA